MPLLLFAVAAAAQLPDPTQTVTLEQLDAAVARAAEDLTADETLRKSLLQSYAETRTALEEVGQHARELDRFLDIFYKARDVFKGELRLPDRKSLNQIVRSRCDKNKDNHLQFHEIRDLLQVAAVVTADKMEQYP